MMVSLPPDSVDGNPDVIRSASIDDMHTFLQIVSGLWQVPLPSTADARTREHATARLPSRILARAVGAAARGIFAAPP